MTKEEVNKLHEELNELSAFEEWNLERMVEIAKVLNAYYMWKDKESLNPNIKQKCKSNVATVGKP